jgi:hypothetical protein
VFVLFLLAKVFPVLLRITTSYYPFGIFKKFSGVVVSCQLQGTKWSNSIQHSLFTKWIFRTRTGFNNLPNKHVGELELLGHRLSTPWRKLRSYVMTTNKTVLYRLLEGAYYFSKSTKIVFIEEGSLHSL